MSKIFLRLKDPRGVSNLTKPEFWEQYKNKIIQKISTELPGFISDYVANGGFFKSRTGNAVQSFRAKPTPRGVFIYSVADYLTHLNSGVPSHQMTYLLNAEERTYLAFGKYPYRGRAFIPIPTGLGKIFRRATAEAMAQGKWIHPGLPKLEFFEKAIEAYLQDFVSNHTQFVLEIAKSI